jgi:hypothetical protein
MRGSGCRHDLRDRRSLEVDRRAAALAQRAVQLVPRDREQVRPEARLLAELSARPHAREERRLHELVGLGLVLGLEEPRHGVSSKSSGSTATG